MCQAWVRYAQSVVTTAIFFLAGGSVAGVVPASATAPAVPRKERR